jgi:hypothetical protein
MQLLRRLHLFRIELTLAVRSCLGKVVFVPEKKDGGKGKVLLKDWAKNNNTNRKTCNDRKYQIIDRFNDYKHH